MGRSAWAQARVWQGFGNAGPDEIGWEPHFKSRGVSFVLRSIVFMRTWTTWMLLGIVLVCGRTLLGQPKSTKAVAKLASTKVWGKVYRSDSQMPIADVTIDLFDGSPSAVQGRWSNEKYYALAFLLEKIVGRSPQSIHSVTTSANGTYEVNINETGPICSGRVPSVLVCFRVTLSRYTTAGGQLGLSIWCKRPVTSVQAHSVRRQAFSSGGWQGGSEGYQPLVSSPRIVAESIQTPIAWSRL